MLCAGALGWYFRASLAGLHTQTPTVAKPATKAKPAPAGKVRPPPEAADRFQFYDLLPDAEVQVAEPPRVAQPEAPPPVLVPGTYVVQAGAFPDLAEADKVKRKLSLLGVVSEIQRAEANGALFHRVRIGPIENLDELNRLRLRLRANHIDYVVIPIGE